MMLRTGNRKGFTLIEVMLATCILALGTVLIYQAFFISLDTFNYCAHYLEVAPFANEKIWQAKENLSESAVLDLESSGVFVSNGRNFVWEVSYSPIEEVKDKTKLFKVDLRVSWQEGRKKIEFSRVAYALYQKE